MCASRFAWSLWQGEGQEEVVRAGLWSLGTGFSSVMLQVPRARANKILEELQKQKVKRQDLQELVKHWLIESDGFCAKLVLFSSSSSNGTKLGY
ncbi:hypothetical protein MAR_004091 [Mya arenaria]|uniref:Uncharacterized protein n=1 Tax=Mya arenaria TaxID=6604 RepID=A0ABY7EZA5_MYAAR|nr:hypothetical protein MAR_004091 [Mya arenaria]